jgi:hypothetical protein
MLHGMTHGRGTLGLVIGIVAGVAGVVGNILTPAALPGLGPHGGALPLPREALICSYIVYLIPLAVTVAALAGQGKPPGRWLPAAALGSWFASLTWIASDLIGKPGSFSGYAATDRNWGAYLVTLLGDLLGILAVILLLVAFRRPAGPGRRAMPRAVPVLARAVAALVFIGTLAGPAIWYLAVYDVRWPCCSASSFNSYLDASRDVTAAEMVLAVAVAALAGACALRFTDPVLGGAVFAGWLAVAIFDFLTFITEGFYFDREQVTENWAAALVLAATAALTIIYLRSSRRPAPSR